MAGTFKFELVSPERVFLIPAGDAEQVLLSGAEGDMTILPGHAPVISTPRPGILEIEIGGTKVAHVREVGLCRGRARARHRSGRKGLRYGRDGFGRVADELKIAEAELADAKDDDAKAFAERALEQLRALAR